MVLSQTFQELINVFCTAYDAVNAYNIHFLSPKAVFKNVQTGRDLLRQVEILVPLLWYCEQSNQISEKNLLKLRACYVAMREEAEFLTRAEYLLEFGTEADLDDIRRLLQKSRLKNYHQHAAFVELGNKRLNLA